MNLNILLDSGNTVSVFGTYLTYATDIAQILGTIAVVVYVAYTYLTFKQIKKQTDYQQDAYLKPSYEISDTLDTKFGKSKLNEELPNVLKSALKPHFSHSLPDNIFEGSYFTLVCINFGNAEVNRLSIKLDITVKQQKEVAEAKGLSSEIKRIIPVEIDALVERNKGKIHVPLISTAAFPYYSIKVTGTYYDYRDKEYILTPVTCDRVNTQFHKLPK